MAYTTVDPNDHASLPPRRQGVLLTTTDAARFLGYAVTKDGDHAFRRHVSGEYAKIRPYTLLPGGVALFHVSDLQAFRAAGYGGSNAKGRRASPAVWELYSLLQSGLELTYKDSRVFADGSGLYGDEIILCLWTGIGAEQHGLPQTQRTFATEDLDQLYAEVTSIAPLSKWEREGVIL